MIKLLEISKSNINWRLLLYKDISLWEKIIYKNNLSNDLITTFFLYKPKMFIFLSLKMLSIFPFHCSQEFFNFDVRIFKLCCKKNCYIFLWIFGIFKEQNNYSMRCMYVTLIFVFCFISFCQFVAYVSFNSKVQTSNFIISI